jgi:hypothetical protein
MFDISELLDQILDYTNMPEDKQDHAEAAVKLQILAIYHGAIAAGQDAKAEAVKEFAVRYAGFTKDMFLLLLDGPKAA